MRALHKVILTALMLVVFMIVPAMAADVTIPMNKDYTSQYGNSSMVIHLIAVNITDYTMGNEFTPYGADGTIWPKLLFTYKNTANTPNYGHLEIKFVDDQGNTYARTDDTMNHLQPGQTSEMRFLEAAVPKDRKIVSVQIKEGFDTTTFPLTYNPGTSSSNNNNPIASSLPFEQGCCLGPLLLPLVAVGALFVARKKQ